MDRDQDPARRAAIRAAISTMVWEGSPLPGEEFPTLNPDLAKAEDATNPPTHPLGRVVKRPASEIVMKIEPQLGQP